MSETPKGEEEQTQRRRGRTVTFTVPFADQIHAVRMVLSDLMRRCNLLPDRVNVARLKVCLGVRLLV
jgi:hypothetical protein